MDKTILEDFIQQGLSQRGIASAVGKSQGSVKHWLKKYGLKTKTEKEYRCKCGETNREKFVNQGGGRRSYSCCKKCHARYTIERFRKYKLQAIEYKGGKCVCCGYDACPGSLGFHHRDPSQKDPQWRKMRTWRFERIKKELDKCDLVCANCHGEIHWQLDVGA